MKVHIHPHYAAYESYIRAIPSAAYEREEDRSVAFPSVTALPEIFFAVQFDRVKLSTESVG